MAEIETKYEPSRNPMLMVLHTKPFNPDKCSLEDKQKYLKAKALVDKVANAQKTITDIEIKYEPNRDPKLMIYHTEPFNTSKCSEKDKKAYETAKKIVDEYVPKFEYNLYELC